MELLVDDLACRRGGRLIFSHASFRLAAGQASILRGPNGSGKSTLLRALAGFLPPVAGQAWMHIDAKSWQLGKDGEHWREQIAMAGHLDAVKPALSLRENLGQWASIYGRGAKMASRVDAALERLGLGHMLDDPAGVCSAGQKRRLGLARLLVTDRPLWLLDEPTVSLDVEHTALFAQIVKEHCAQGGIALAATHIDLGFGEDAIVDMRVFIERAQEARAGAGDIVSDIDDPFLEGDF